LAEKEGVMERESVADRRRHGFFVVDTPVQIAALLVNDMDEGSKVSVRRVGNSADDPRQLDFPPLINIVYNEQDEVLNKTDSNQTNLRECAPVRALAQAPIPRLIGCRFSVSSA
jgi:hypothetical protein